MILISASVEEIGDFSFKCCHYVPCAKFNGESKLKRIGRFALTGSQISHFEFPSSVEMIGDRSFGFCRSLSVISFKENSKLHEINADAFENSCLETVYYLPCIQKYVQMFFGWMKINLF